ncbi:MAG: hypothetical protein ACREH3_10685, partial [Geminicoccales bacterium]
PEMTRAMVDRWTSSADAALELARAGARPREAQLLDFDRYALASDRWLARLLDEHLLDQSVPITN